MFRSLSLFDLIGGAGTKRPLTLPGLARFSCRIVVKENLYVWAIGLPIPALAVFPEGSRLEMSLA